MRSALRLVSKLLAQRGGSDLLIAVVTWWTSGQVSVTKGQLGKRLVNASGVCVNMTAPVETMDVGSHGRLSFFERCGWE